jgi:hypothetical protein
VVGQPIVATKMTPGGPFGKETLTGSDRSDSMNVLAPKRVVRFPAERIVRSGRGGATRLDIWFGRIRQWVGSILNSLGVPGAIRAMEFRDKLTGQSLAVSVGELFVCISVNGRDYYFDRITGSFDGTGAGPD